MSKKNFTPVFESAGLIVTESAKSAMEITNTVIYDGISYPEIRAYSPNGKINTLSVKIFLHENGLLSANDLMDPKCDFQPIAAGLLKAFQFGILSLNATKQKGIKNNTPVRMSTSLGGKMKNVWAFSTLSLCNKMCLARMKNKDLVCAHCYVKKSLYIWAVLNYVQNSFILMNYELPAEWIPVIIEKNVEKHPYIRIESFGDLANRLQAENYLRIVYANSLFKFGAWTKNPAYMAHAIDRYGKPENLSTVFSMSRVDYMDSSDKYDAYFDHKFIVVRDQSLKDSYLERDNFYPCQCGPESCRNCHKCYMASKTVTTAVELLRK